MYSFASSFHTASNSSTMYRTGSKGPMLVFAGNSHPELANLITEKLGIHLGHANCYHKSNRETVVDIGESVRGKMVYVIQTGTKYVHVDRNQLDALLFHYTLPAKE